MNTILALSGVVIKELYRRKDFYVLFVLTAVITLLLGSVSFFNDPKIARYLKEVVLLLIWVAALVVAIGTTARQIPAERENRTIFPLLAKPVTRGQVIVGKFAGCWLACGLALVVFYAFFTIVSGSREGHWPLLHLVQAFWLQWVMLAVVVAIVLLGRYLNQVALREPEPLRTVVYTIYFLIPHLEWYDIRDFIVYNRNLIG